ncbi:tRNA (5-methylaminomethyl-2-thiouridine)(34)-methyltransferase MnmD [Thermophagus sp. OGC60D27]|uniref:tRNA (5-methylaminomethyl-2-thiouridine)(34)-methyltransferase MnmD n=1 Tax=Thermophagus sp. OGC60D27 TaxID=3458415 RepID=UPI00403807BE
MNKDFPQIILKTSEDGSSTLYRPDLDEHYHSIHGAIQESMHVFIRAGLQHYLKMKAPNGSDSVTPQKRIEIKTNPNIQNKIASHHRPKVDPIHILEAGFGTGLNALLALVYSNNHPICYHSLEKYPLPPEITEKINYPDHIPFQQANSCFQKIHKAPWNHPTDITSLFRLVKEQTEIQNFVSNKHYDLVFYDAFAPDKQPELWTPEIFQSIAGMMSPGAILTTYSAKGSVKRALQNAGLIIEKIPGPPGKREMLRATKPAS